MSKGELSRGEMSVSRTLAESSAKWTLKRVCVSIEDILRQTSLRDNSMTAQTSSVMVKSVWVGHRRSDHHQQRRTPSVKVVPYQRFHCTGWISGFDSFIWTVRYRTLWHDLSFRDIRARTIIQPDGKWVMAKEQWQCSAAGKVTVDLMSHYPCVTDCYICLRAQWTRTPPIYTTYLLK